MTWITSTSITIDVDIEDTDLDDDTLREICEKRGIVTDSTEEIDDDITEMFYALKLGRNDRALELARKVAQDRTGRLL